ncbi:MAG: class II aldolase/adducin family protein [Thermodesulfobacteriota bacterium]
MTTQAAEAAIRLRSELSDFSRRSFQRDLVSGTGGNMSVRIPGTDTVLITPSGVSLADVEPDDNLLVRLDGTVLENPRNLVPSKETSFHLAVYQLRPDVGAIAHVHPPCATAYSALRKPLPLPTTSARVILKEVPAIEVALPGSAELREIVKAGIVRHPGVKALLMAEHGILAFGPDIATAYYIADLVESTAKVAHFEAGFKKND